jgi:hypothetical protein
MKLRSRSLGVPKISKIESRTWPSVVGNPSASIFAFLGEMGKQCDPWNNYKVFCLPFPSSRGLLMYLNRSPRMTPHDQISICL